MSDKNEHLEQLEKNNEPKDDVEGHVFEQVEQLEDKDVEGHMFEQVEQFEKNE
jgi:hypothetical protein